MPRGMRRRRNFRSAGTRRRKCWARSDAINVTVVRGDAPPATVDLLGNRKLVFGEQDEVLL